MSEFVKLKTNGYKGVTKGRYYEVRDEYLDPTDNDWCYMIRLDNMIDCGFYPQEDFEKPITHVRCINNEGSKSVLTANKIYEIVSINYIGGELITVKNDVGQTGQYSSKRFKFIEKGDNVWIKLREDLHPMDLFGIYSVGSISQNKIYKVVDSNEQCYSILDDNGRYIQLHKSYFVENPSVDLCEEKEEPRIYSLGTIAEPLEPLPETKYHITYSLQYAEGVELADIEKHNIIQIDGEIVSKGRAWVIETDKGTVIIPFKAIIHMHPQY